MHLYFSFAEVAWAAYYWCKSAQLWLCQVSAELHTWSKDLGMQSIELYVQRLELVLRTAALEHFSSMMNHAVYSDYGNFI